MQEGFVPNRPSAIKVSIATETLVFVKLGATEIVFESGGLSKGLKAHRPIGSSVEKRRVIAFLVEFSCQPTQMIERSRSEEEGFYKHRDARKHRRHAIDALAPVGKRLFVGGTHRNERIEKWGGTFIFSTIEVFIERAHKLLSKTLENEHHHIFAQHLSLSCARGMER